MTNAVMQSDLDEALLDLLYAQAETIRNAERRYIDEKRDRMAMEILQGLMGGSQMPKPVELAKQAYEITDAMIYHQKKHQRI